MNICKVYDTIVPKYVADGFDGDDLTFSNGAPPTDGSVLLALVEIDISQFPNFRPEDPKRRLIVFTEIGISQSIRISFIDDGPGGLPPETENKNVPAGWQIY